MSAAVPDSPAAPDPPRIVVPPEVAEAVRAAGGARLVTPDGVPLLRVRPESPAELRARAPITVDEERAIFTAFQTYDGPTVSDEELLSRLRGARTPHEADERPAVAA